MVILVGYRQLTTVLGVCVLWNVRTSRGLSSGQPVLAREDLCFTLQEAEPVAI